MSSAPPEVPRNLLALKSMVIAMALLLVICAVILVGVGISRLSDSGVSGEKAFDPVSLPLPAGCEIGDVTAEGQRLIVEIGGAEHCRRIVIADMESGKVTGEFAFPPQ